jgi:hypothetical protein
MTKSEAYKGIYDEDPDCKVHGVFFAFSNEQLERGMKECGYKEYSEIVHAGSGLYGSKQAIDSFLGVYDARAKRVAEICDPQTVYDYEFANYECDIDWNGDENAITLIIEIFGKERAKTVKRRRVVVDIDEVEAAA